MFELVVRAFDSGQKPAIRFQLLDDLSAVHGGYCHHHVYIINTIPTKNQPFLYRT